MSWKKRISPSNVSQVLGAPHYGSGSGYFTIKMHHNGKFDVNARRDYIGGVVDFFDFCSADEMSMIEIQEMARLCGIDPDSVAFTYSKSGVDDCNNLTVLETDINAMNLAYFLDKDNCVGIYVEHEEPELSHNAKEVEGDQNDTETNGGFYYEMHDNLPEVSEGMEFIGDLHESGPGEPSSMEQTSKNVEIRNSVDLIDNDDRYEVVDAHSVGEDSVLSDILVDSDGYISDEKVDLEAISGGVVPINAETLGEDFVKNGIDANEPNLQHEIEYYGGFQVFNPKVDMENPQFHEGLIFDDATTIRAAIRQHSMKHGRECKFKKNDSDKIQVKCKTEDCPWYIYASSFQKGVKHGPLQVKVFKGPHQCSRKAKVMAATSTWVAKRWNTHIKTEPRWKAKSMITVIDEETQLILSPFQMYRAKKKVREFDMGNEQKQYAMLWRYASEIMKSDSESTVRIKPREVDGKKLFSRIYICWGALKHGFQDGCRKIICLDGCHIKTNYGGIILTALGLDANNGMYPLAYAVVEKEKKETWKWFLEYVKMDLGIDDGTSRWTFMSDKQKGLIYAVEELFPNCDHRFCVLHMYNNFRQHHRGLAFKKIMWKAARCTTVVEFEKVLNELKNKDLKSFQWLVKSPAEGWSKSYFRPGAKSDMLLNNISESFNKMIVHARSKPIIEMLEEIRVILMTRVYMNRDKMKKWYGNICPRIHNKLEELKKMSGGMQCRWNGDQEFCITDLKNGDFKVNVGDMTCACRRWQLTGYPCAHAIRAMRHMGWNIEDFVDECYKKSTYLKVYSHCMHVLNGIEECPLSDQPDLFPPLIEKQAGRPKKYARKKSKQEIEETKAKLAKEKAKEAGILGKNGTIIKCRYCGGPGHNQRTCELKKKHLAEQAMGRDGGSSSGTGPTVIQNTQSSITEAMRTLEKHGNLSIGKSLQNDKGNDHNMVNSTQESHVRGASRPSKLHVIKGGGKKNAARTQEHSLENVDGRNNTKKPWRI